VFKLSADVRTTLLH